MPLQQRLEQPRSVEVQCVVVMQGSGPQNGSQNVWGPAGAAGEQVVDTKGHWDGHMAIRVTLYPMAAPG